MLDGPGLAIRQAFGEPVLIRRAGQADAAIVAVYDRRRIDVDTDGEATVTVARTVIGFRTSDMPWPVRKKDTVVIVDRAETYRVQDIRPDGENWTELLLERADGA